MVVWFSHSRCLWICLSVNPITKSEEWNISRCFLALHFYNKWLSFCNFIYFVLSRTFELGFFFVECGFLGWFLICTYWWDFWYCGRIRTVNTYLIADSLSYNLIERGSSDGNRTSIVSWKRNRFQDCYLTNRPQRLYYRTDRFPYIWLDTQDPILFTKQLI